MNEDIAANRATDKRARTGTITGLEIPTLVRAFVRARHTKSAPSTVSHTFQELKFLEEFLGEHKFLASAGVPDNDVWSDYCAYIAKSYHANYAQRIIMRAKSLLQWLYQARVLRYDCAGLVKTPTMVPAKSSKPFTASQYYQLLEAAKTFLDGQWLWMVVAGWHTGASISDVCLLKWASVDFQNMMLRFGRLKQRSSIQNVPIIPGSEFHQMMHERSIQPFPQTYPNDPITFTYYVDVHFAEKYIHHHDSMAVPFRRLLTECGFSKEYSYHSFRHSLCSRLANANVATSLCCKITGHKDPKVFVNNYVQPQHKALHENYIHASQVYGAMGGTPQIKEPVI
jgi:integrase